MTHKELGNLLKKAELPLVYSHFGKPQEPPFLVYIRTGNENIEADNKVWQKKMNYDIELYTSKKDTAKEKIIEDLLDDAEIFYDIEEVYIESEKMFEVIYSIQI